MRVLQVAVGRDMSCSECDFRCCLEITGCDGIAFYSVLLACYSCFYFYFYFCCCFCYY